MADYSFLKPLFGADGSKAVTYNQFTEALDAQKEICLLYTSPSTRD